MVETLVEDPAHLGGVVAMTSRYDWNIGMRHTLDVEFFVLGWLISQVLGLLLGLLAVGVLGW
jgi:hypothetical protein